MSLVDRVKLATRQTEVFVGHEESRQLEALKQSLNQRISSDEIAAIAAKSPFRAKNEIKTACARIFEEPIWLDVAAETKEQLIEKLIDMVFGLGPLEGMLQDNEITEIMVNGSQSVFYEKDGKLYASDYVFADNDQVRALIDRIIGPLGRRIDEASPMVNARLKQGHRVHAIIPPLSLEGPVLTIRKFREHIFTLTEMREIGTIDQGVRQFLIWMVLLRKNIAISGGTGSGKTTFLNALSCEIEETERIITIEDSAELKFSTHPHVVRLEARPRNAEGTGEVTIRDLVINALRMRPDRIIVGECRGGEALDMLVAMNTGHDGSLTTLHANSPADAVMRLVTMVRYVADLPLSAIEAQISGAIDVLIQTARAIDGLRYVQEIALFRMSDDRSRCEVDTLFRRDEGQDSGVWSALPSWLDEIVSKRIASQKEVNAWKQQVLSPA
ncbi:MAG: CpaF family protein [Raoultibacter sp.]|jgi:pilus assembly protein CpaF